ncbi:type IV secretory system conjugative DNA transfer family protein [Streptomyces chartreusis]|uniref:Type IV secretory system conjugative DNA transfer family protein n=1 Tax=Streptomyces chartreusis TaxID=1969 RepID=A0A7H8TAY6_STRCX|nr:TraM recognition domain-containing protein [Streptomyces chartreusis]QKZ20587.1 type IV secretory system conjugative DNA transfer family protein [Streptomyces chartreusis]
MMSHAKITAMELAATPVPGLPGSDTDPSTHDPAIIEHLNKVNHFIYGPGGIAVAVIAAASMGGIGWVWAQYAPRPGFASKREIREEMSARHARELIPQTRPSLVGQEKTVPTTAYAVPLGRLRSGGLPTGIWGTPEMNYLILAPSRQGKSIILNSMIYQWDGAVVHTSSKVGDHLATKALRELLGPVWVWDPLGISGAQNLNTFRWDPVRGCEARDVAIQRAAYLLYGSRDNASSGVDAFFKSTACEVLSRFMHAAALGGKTMMDVYRWSQNRKDQTATNILQMAGAQDWAELLVQRQQVVQGTGDGIYTTLSNALGWMANPKVAATVLPGPGEHFDAETFLLNHGTLYMIGSDKPGSAVAPLFVMFADYLRSVTIDLGNKNSSGRMDPPCLWALDEIANIIPLPVDSWMPDSGGRGITLVIVIQSRAQLFKTWGEQAGRIIWDDANVRVFLRGIGDMQVRKEISEMCGTYEKERKTTTTKNGETSVSRSTEEKPVITPGQVFKIGKRQSLVIFAGCSPVLTHIKPLWKRRDVKKLTSKPKVPGQRSGGSGVSMTKGRR